MKKIIRRGSHVAVLALVGLCAPAHAFDVNRQTGELNHGTAVKGTWGPNKAQIRYAEIAFWYRPQDNSVCPPLPFVLLTDTGSTGFTCSHGQLDASSPKKIQSYTEYGSPVEMKLLVPSINNSMTLNPVPADAPQLSGNTGMIAVMRQLQVFQVANGQNTSGKSGNIDFTFNSDFTVTAAISSPLENRSYVDRSGLSHYLIDYTIKMPKKDDWMSFYDVVATFPQLYANSSGQTPIISRSINNLVPMNFQYDRPNQKYVFQGFMKLPNYSGMTEQDYLGKTKFALYRQKWGTASESQLCLDASCRVSPEASPVYNPDTRYSQIEYSPMDSLTVPGRLSFRLATKDEQGKALDTSGLVLKAWAIRRTDGKRVDGEVKTMRFSPIQSLYEDLPPNNPAAAPWTPETRVYLQLDDEPGSVYDLFVSVKMNDTEYTQEMINPNRPFYKIVRKGTPAGVAQPYPENAYQASISAWNTYTVGRGFASSNIPWNRKFDTYPLFDVYFRKPSITHAGVRFIFESDSLSGAKITAKAVRRSDKKELMSKDIGFGAEMNLDDYPDELYDLSFKVLYEGVEYTLNGLNIILPGAKTYPAILSVRHMESNKTYGPKDKGWEVVSPRQGPSVTYAVGFRQKLNGPITPPILGPIVR